MIKYKKSDKKAELIKLCEENGIEVDEEMSKDEIMSELDKFNEALEASGDEPVDNDSDADNDDEDSETNETITPDDSDEGNDEDSETPAEESELELESYDCFAYIGPSVPSTSLKENAIFNGYLSDVKEFLSDIIEEYPQIEKLIIPVSLLAKYTNKVKKAGNIYNVYYNDVVSAIKGNKEV